MSTGKPLRADAQRNRAALVATAREVLNTGGFFDLRFDDFAALAGVGRATLYRHFPTRAALAEAAYGEEIAALGMRARDLEASLPGHEALSVFLRGVLTHMQTHQGLAWTLAVLLAPASTDTTEGTQVVRQAVTNLVNAAINEGTVREDADAGAILVALQGIGTAYGRPRWETEADGLLTLVLDGLRQSAVMAASQ